MVAVLALGLVGCGGNVGTDGSAPGGATPGAAASEEGSVNAWVEFGAFEKPAEFAGDPALPGPATIAVPDAGTLVLDASAFLPGEDIMQQVYTTSYDESVPMIIGVVQSWTPGAGREVAGYATTVLGIEVASGTAELRTMTRVYLGEPHTMELAGRSDLGVVAVAVEGVLDQESPDTIRRTLGIDAARGTHVWSMDGGYPGYGEGTARLFHAAARDGCAERVDRYHVGSGRILEVDEYPGAADLDPAKAAETGGCVRAIDTP